MRSSLKPIAIFFLFTCLLSFGRLSAQNDISYGYDLSGNRIQREIVLAPSIRSSSDSTGNRIYSEALKDLSVRIYPNPTKGNLKIEILESSRENPVSLKLYNLSGSLILERNRAQNFEEIDISGQPQGVYLLKINSGNAKTEWKIIKE